MSDRINRLVGGILGDLPAIANSILPDYTRDELQQALALVYHNHFATALPPVGAVINGRRVGDRVSIDQEPKNGVGFGAEIVGHHTEAWQVRLDDGSLYNIDCLDL